MLFSVGLLLIDVLVCLFAGGNSFEPNLQLCLKKNLNASRPSEHPPVRGGGGMLKRLGGIESLVVFKEKSGRT